MAKEVDFKTVLGQLPGLIFVKDEQLRYLFLNNGLDVDFGDAFHRIEGKTDADLFPESIAQYHILCDESVLKTHETLDTGPLQYQSATGQHWLKTIKKPYPLPNGKTGILGLVIDVEKEWQERSELHAAEQFESTIQRLTKSMFFLDDEKAILHEFVYNAFIDLDLTDCVIYLVNHESRKMTKEAAYPIEVSRLDPSNKDEVLFSEGIIGRTARTGQTQLVPNTSLDPDYQPEEGKQRASEITVPVYYQNELIAIIDSEHEQPGFFQELHLKIFETAARLLGVKLGQVRLLNRVKSSENYLNQILESPKSLVVFSLDRAYRYKAFNQNHQNIMKTIWGVDIEIGESMFSYIQNQADCQKAKKNFDRAFTDEEFTIIEKYGDENLKRSYWEDFYSPQKDTDGNIVGVTVFVRDISTEMQYKEQLEENERLLSSINQNVRDGIARFNLSKGFVYTSAGMSDLFGYTKEHFTQLAMVDLFASAGDATTIMQELREEMNLRNREVLCKKRDGTTFWALLNGQLKSTDHGTFIDASVTNIAELKQVQSNLKANLVQLEKINTELDHIVYRTSHDMRSPVASILGLLHLMEHEYAQNQGVMKHLKLIDQLVQRLDHIIHEIIAYRKSAIQGTESAPVDVADLCHNLLDTMEQMDGSQHVKKTVQWQSYHQKPIVQSDALRLDIILNNLLSNAVKYADHSKAQPFVKIQFDIQPHVFRLQVQDNGMGIEESQQSDIFNMFYRATNKAHGTGLGLFILKEAVAKLKGKVQVQSAEGKGSTFTVELPNGRHA